MGISGPPALDDHFQLPQVVCSLRGGGGGVGGGSGVWVLGFRALESAHRTWGVFRGANFRPSGAFEAWGCGVLRRLKTQALTLGWGEGGGFLWGL